MKKKVQPSDENYFHVKLHEGSRDGSSGGSSRGSSGGSSESSKNTIYSLSVFPQRACYQSVVIPIENVVGLICGLKTQPIGSALWLVHWNRVRYSVVPPDEPSCEEKCLSEALHEPSHDTYFNLKVHMKHKMNIFLHMKVHVKTLVLISTDTIYNYNLNGKTPFFKKIFIVRFERRYSTKVHPQ